MKIALIGYGKMGKAIEAVAKEASHQIVARIDDGASDQWPLLTEADVAIEFTQPHAARENIMRCLEAQVPIVVGTTGWYAHLAEISALVEQHNGALLHASNFSIGVNIFMEVNRILATLMNTQSQYNVSLSETHHTEKLDTPSGTAITLAEDIISAMHRKTKWVNDKTTESERIEILSHRVPNVPGTHVIKYQSEIDDIELIHTAKSRAGFARGAVTAAEWLSCKKGVFTMKDVLNLTHFR